MKLNKFKLGVVACFLSVSLSGYAQNEITDAQIQQAEAVPLPAHPGPGQFNNAEDYFVAQAQLAGYSIRSVEIAIDCRKVPYELMDHIFRLQVSGLHMAAVKSFGNDKGELSLKGDHEFTQVVQTLDSTIDLWYATRKKNPPSKKQCEALTGVDFSTLVSSMKGD